MIYGRFLVALALSAGFVDVAFARDGQGRGGFQGFQGGQNGQNGNQGQNQGGSNGTAVSSAADSGATGTPTTGNDSQDVLDPANVQTGSASDGQGQASGVAAGQAASETDAANFINFCTDKTLTNGAQVKGGSCNGIVMGDIPATTNMVSTILTNPVGGCLPANQDFKVNLQVANLNAGVFTNPTVTYYSAPQGLTAAGKIIGHVHVTVQTLGDNLTPQQAPDASTFAFFKGIDDDGDGNGGLSADVTGGLPAGSYRVCTMSAAANHQPVIMPVAQRGAQDDCVRFTVADNCDANGGGGTATSGSNSTATAAAGTGSSSAAANANNGQNGQQGGQQGQQQGNQQGQQGRGGRGGRGRRMRHRFQSRPYVL